MTSGGGGATVADHAKSPVIAPSGGACTAAATTTPAAVTTTPGRVCTPPPSCQEQLCDSDGGASGYAVCIATNGTPGTCPTGWGATPVVVGTAATLTCTNACTCDVNGGSSCTNAKLAVYSDGTCNTLVDTLTIDNTCEDNRTHGNGSSLGSFKYGATLTQQCTVGGSTTPQVMLNGAQTICCRP